MLNKESHYIDSLLPAEMAVQAEEIGVKKAVMNFGSLFTLSVLAGAFIAFGAVLSTLVATNAGAVVPYGISRLLTGFVFSLGLILVVVGGAELFTGNNLIVMSWANGRITSYQMLRNWLIVYLGNFVGALGIALLVFLSGQPFFANGEIARTALSIANHKSGLNFGEALALGVLCNVLVCLAVWLSYSGRTAADKILAVVPPITAFVACGFEHSIANMYFIPAGLMLKYWVPDSLLIGTGINLADYPNLTLQNFFANNLVPVTIGNVIGGAGLVGIVYWFVYLRKHQIHEGKKVAVLKQGEIETAKTEMIFFSDS